MRFKVVVSKDTDICILLLHYTSKLIKPGLSGLRLKHGVETMVLFLPLHLIFTRIDQNICDVLFKAHILTGCGVTSKFEAKSAALKSNFHVYLKHFSENKLLESSFFEAMYLIKVQKQPPRGVPRKRYSENIQQIYRRTPMPKCDFNKVALQLYQNRTSAWVFTCKFAAYFQNTFS